MIWRRWVTESSSSAPQISSDHLDRWFSNTRKRPPQSGLVQVGFWEVAAATTFKWVSSRLPTSLGCEPKGHQTAQKLTVLAHYKRERGVMLLQTWVFG